MQRSKVRSGAMLLSLALAAPASAGTISVAWDPVNEPDLAGYRVYYGTTAGSYSQQQDVGTAATTLTLTGLTDCTTYYVAVKARDAAGQLSTGYSNEVTGMPRPTLALLSPVAAEQGSSVSLVIQGANFASGATLQFSNPAITVQSVTVNSCTQITAAITVGATAVVGAVNVDVTNSNGVFGTSTGLFAVQAAILPTIAGATPANGATNVSATVHPSVTFSEPIKASSVTASTVKLLDSVGSPVAQAAGSPTLAADGLNVLIVPAAPLAFGRTYRIQVTGGSTGVRDLANNPMTATYTQGTGFTTQADSTAPAISAVSANPVQSTTATITWTTDEAADSQVFYRKSGDVTYQSTDVDATLGTTHTMVLQGLTPSTSYAFYVSSSDAENNTSTSSPDASFTTTSNGFSYIVAEAENGTVTAPMRTVPGTGIFRGAWIDTPSSTPTGTASVPSGRSEISFYVPSDGTWRVWVRLYGGSTSSDTWYETVDGATRATLAPSTVGTWKWASGRNYSLTRGLHMLELGGREAQARADRVLITNDASFIPTETPGADVTPPAAPTGLAAEGGNATVTLRWTNPASDVERYEVRYRSDGRFPQTPVDGMPVSSGTAAAGAQGTATHSGLTNGATLHYSVFAIDGEGNASPAAQIQATPQVDTPPAAPGSAWRTDRR